LWAVLQVFKLGEGFGALALEAGFLDVQVAEGFFVFEVGFGLDESSAMGVGLVL
jgi:hypothetical protein